MYNQAGSMTDKIAPVKPTNVTSKAIINEIISQQLNLFFSL